MNKFFEKYMIVQIKRIEIEKWYEGEKINEDPGKKFILEWIEKNGEKFKKLWNESLCKNCINYKRCGYKIRKECDEYEKE